MGKPGGKTTFNLLAVPFRPNWQMTALRLSGFVFVQLACFFHYGKEDLDVISLSFRKDIWIHHINIYPPPAEDKTVSTPMQDVLMKKLGEGAYPFTFNIPTNLPCSVSFLPAAWDKGKACGVDFKIIAYIANEAENPNEKIDNKGTCQLIIRKIQFAPDMLIAGPEVNIYKQFMFSGKTIHLEASIKKGVYYHGEPIQIRVKINNQTKKVVKKIRISIDQTVDIELYSTDKHTKVVLCEEFRDQVNGQTTFGKEYLVTPLLANNRDKYGLALDGRLKDEDTNLASSTVQISESDKRWRARRQFITKHIAKYDRKDRDKLLALSMVWVNHVFMGCRYGPQLMQRVLEMAEGIHVGEMPSYELVSSAEAKKRPNSSDGSEEPMSKMPMSKFGPRPRFEPVHFVSGSSSSTSVLGCADEKENEKERRSGEVNSLMQREPHQPHSSSHGYDPHSSSSYGFDSWAERRNKDMSFSNRSGFGYGGRGPTSNFMGKMHQEYSARYEAQSARQANSPSQSSRFDSYAGGRSGRWDSGRHGLGFGHKDRPSSSKGFTRSYDSPSRGSPGLLPTPNMPTPVPPATLDEKQKLVTRVVSAVAVTIQDPEFVGGVDGPNYNFILSRSIQACKTNPEYIYVNLKDIPPSDFPKNKKIPPEGYACELRCSGVYLATGYSGSKNGARDRASEQAVRLFMKPVEVRVVQRLYKRNYVNDLVVCQVNAPTPALVPPLRNPEDSPPPSTKGQYVPDKSKHWTEFVIMENAHDAICILNNSAAYNRMKIDYSFDPVPNTTAWVCSVYLQGELLAQARGTKKSSKHAAAEEAVKRLRMNQVIRQQQEQQDQYHQQQLSQGNPYADQPGASFSQYGGRKKQLSELVILENSDNSICIINDTAQFNKVAADYKFTMLPDFLWRCEVYIEGQFVAEAIGPKKTVKHIAAKEAIATLKRTQAVVKSNLRKEGYADAISRNQIMARSGEETTQQEIKEDNIGNQLLRKMGWTGGGLGREGEGIAEPIMVKEQFSREGLGMDMEKHGHLTKRDIEDIIRNYACSERQDDLRFSTELNNEERKQIHQVSQKYGLRSKSYGQGRHRFLIVSRRVQKDQLIGQLLQEGQVGRYELVKPQAP
ncbi:NF-kappa-B-repressing factor [Bagarius yarrelli]|uniref:Arrestin-C n=1 Tax=Bagarius yarrelli TaxID=175774 RepID=A0A556V0E5_BAGYA|nr:NF-kappa-B-repressing factor [Bagarius yarrelli]